MELIAFDPTVDQLNKMIAVTSAITAEDLSDDKQIALVKSNRISLRDARITIEKRGKELRADALKYQKDVIAKEKELLAIITPEEDRLKAIEDEAKLIKERAARVALLPMRREQLAAIGAMPLDEFPFENDLLDMDNDQFISYLNVRKAEKLDRDMAEVNAEKARLADEARLAQVRLEAEVAERNRIEAAAKAQEEARMRESEAHAQQAKDKQAKLEKQKKYKAWLEKIGYAETEHGSWYFATKDDVTNAYRLISSFKGV